MHAMKPTGTNGPVAKPTEKAPGQSLLESVAERTQAVIDAGRFQPQTADALEDLAWKYYRSGWLPDCYYPKEAKQRWEKWAIEQGVARAYLSMLKGAALGMNPSEAIWQIHVINNRPSPSADLMFGRMLATGILRRDDFTLKASKTECVIVLGIKTRAVEDRITVTAKYEDFKHLHKKDNWQNHPEDMCVARAKSRACRRWAPDVYAGVYSAEEMRDVREDAASGTFEVPDSMMPADEAPRPPADVAPPNASAEEPRPEPTPEQPVESHEDLAKAIADNQDASKWPTFHALVKELVEKANTTPQGSPERDAAGKAVAAYKARVAT